MGVTKQQYTSADEYISKEAISRSTMYVQTSTFFTLQFSACVRFHIYECERDSIYEPSDIVANGKRDGLLPLEKNN